MTMRSTIAKATVVALPIGLGATAGHAADLVEVAGKMPQLSTFNEAVAASGLADTLAGEGPFTVFAPTDEAFAQLPQPLLSKLLEDGHRAELMQLLEHHLIDGEAITAQELVSGATQLDTAAGDRLTVDGSDGIVLVIATGSTTTRAGSESAERTELSEGSDMPVTEHQQQVLRSDVGEETRQTAPEGQMPATEHQQEVLHPDAGEKTREAASEGSGMPATEHQQEVLRADVGEETPQTAPTGQMPATEHQQAVLADGAQPASVVEADVEAENGVIHVIDAVLVPRATLEQLKGGA